MRLLVRARCDGLPQRPALPGAGGRASRCARGGVTVLELLVVLLILLMVTAAAIPIVVPAVQNRQMRESARLVSSYFSKARSRAVEIGRPVGVVVERFNGQPFAFQLSQVEVPPPYSGDSLSTKAVVSITGGAMNFGENSNEPTSKGSFDNLYNGAGTTRAAIWFTATMNTGDFNVRLVRVGDRIQFGGQGPLYTIYGPDADFDGMIDVSGMTVTLDIAYEYPSTTAYNHNTPLPIRFPWANAVTNAGPIPQATTFQILRQPTRSLTPPLVLPDAIVVDLVCSGVGPNGTFMYGFGGPSAMTGSPPPSGPTVVYDPVVVFSPSGRLESVSAGNLGALTRATDTVYFLLGRRDLMYDATQKGANSDVVAQNLSPIAAVGVTNPPPPPAHFWVSIGAQTGQVSVTEVAPNFQDYQTSKRLKDVIIDALPFARAFAREAQSLGGR